MLDLMLAFGWLIAFAAIVVCVVRASRRSEAGAIGSAIAASSDPRAEATYAVARPVRSHSTRMTGT